MFCPLSTLCKMLCIKLQLAKSHMQVHEWFCAGYNLQKQDIVVVVNGLQFWDK